MRRWGLGILLGMLICFCANEQVYAGEINSAEQSVINYVSGTFEYEGKLYKATESAIGALCSKLAADNVDLTQQEADSAIRQVNANIEAGVNGGYLVQVGEAEKSTDDTDSNKDNSNEKDKNNQKDNTGKKKKLKYSEKLKNIDINSIIKDIIKSGESNSRIYSREQKGEANKNINIISMLDSGEADIITLERYLDGSIISSSVNGKLLYQGGLPIKNTGYNISASIKCAYSIGVMFLITVALACVYIRKNDGKTE